MAKTEDGEDKARSWFAATVETVRPNWAEVTALCALRFQQPAQ